MISKKIICILILVQLVLTTLATAVYYGNDEIGQYRNINVLKFGHYIDKRIEKGLDYLYENQLPNGEFLAYLSLSPDMESKKNISVIADTAFILHTLNIADERHKYSVHNGHSEKILNKMRTGAITFLLNHKESHGVWKFFLNDDITPPDVDTTSATFAALVESGVDISDESLDYMLNYRNPDGVFYVWINSDEWLDPSSPFYNLNITEHCVNADALYAYSLRQRFQTEVIDYLNDIVKNKSFLNGSTYYPSPYFFTYFITKAYSEGNVKGLEPSINDIEKYLLETQNPDGGWGNDLGTALATISLINLDYDAEPLNRAIRYILNNQNKNGSWNMHFIYIQPGDSIKPTNYFGSQELMTSFNLEALIKYRNRNIYKDRNMKK